MDDGAVRRLAASQFGLITRAQAADAGLRRSSWYARLESGRWRSLHPGVAALEGSPPTAEQAVLAAVLSLPGSVASHRSAAYLWGASVDGTTPVDVLSRRGTGARRDGVAIHRPSDGRPVRVAIRHGIPVTTPVRTLLEVGGVTSVDAVECVYEEFLISGVVTSGAVHAALRRHGGRGRPGVGALRAVVDRATLGERPPDSVLEAAMARLIARFRLPVPRFQYEINGPGFRYRVDFAYPDVRVVLEVDGWRYHGSRAAFEADRHRDAVLQGAGWVVLRFTWLQVSRRPDWVAARIAETVRERGAPTPRPG